ncbi:MAG: hypothetical protein HY954_06210 [Deltaproteobacteria bacterium]|nr:hypothetical protein [Deltaproteobacteria bacterium]
MADIYRLITALAVFTLSGFALIRMLDRKDEASLTPAVKYCLSFLIGLGTISLQMFLYSIVSLPYSFYSIAAPWVAIGGLTLLKKTGVRPADKGLGGKKSPVEIIFLLIILSQAAYAFLYATLLPVSGWDAWAIWFLKGRVFFMDKGVSEGFLLDKAFEYAHADYPLLMPLSIAWVFTTLGGANEMAAKALFPLQFLSMLVVFYYIVNKASGGRVAILFTALISLTPIILVHGAGFPVKIGSLYAGDFVGYADLSLAVYFLAAAGFIFLHLLEGKGLYVFFASIFLGLGAWTKNEGLAFAAFGFLVMLLSLIGKRGGASKAVISAGVILLFILPWYFYKSHYGIGSEYTGNIWAAPGNVDRLGLIIPRMLRYMFLNIGLYNFTWWAYIASIAVNYRGFFKGRNLFLNALILFQLAVYIFAYVITPSDVVWQMSTSLDRLILHLAPLAMLAAAVNFGAFIGKDTEAGAG